MPRRAVAVHSQSVALVASEDDERAASILDFVCEALPSAPPPAPLHELHVPSLGSDAERAEELMRELAIQLVTDYAGGLALHAGAIEVNGRAIVFPAVSGAGKSTLTVHLATRGYGFLTDELVLVPSEGDLVHPCARPAHLKPGSMFVLEEAGLIDAPGVWTYSGGALIAPAALGARSVKPRPLGALVFPERRPMGQGSLEPLSAGLGGYLLAGALVNARNLPQLGISGCARLATSASAFRVTYRDLDELRALLAPVIGVAPTDRGA